MLIAFHKPYGVVARFTPDGSAWRTLADFQLPPRVYSLGRLDAESEGLLLLSDEPGLNTRLLDPRHAHGRVYWVQVERVPSPEALAALERGVRIQGRMTQPCRARLLEPAPDIVPRVPPIRYRAQVPDAWVAIELTEGKNRQVRRMTAAVGHPTLRLIRVQIGGYAMGALPPGEWRSLTAVERRLVFQRGAGTE